MDGSETPSLVRLKTDTPLDAMWTYFRVLETSESAQRLLGSEHSAETLAAARDTLRQARSYFFSARTSPMLTRPVLAYYGMISLAKLVLLFDRAQPRTLSDIEDIERKGHGLKQHDNLDPAGQFRLGDCTVEITCDGKPGSLKPRGVFPHLASCIAGSESHKWLGEHVRVHRLFRSIPQLDTVMRETLGSENHFLGLAVGFHSDTKGHTDLVLNSRDSPLMPEPELRDRVPYSP